MWLEAVPAAYITGLSMVPDVDGRKLRITVNASTPGEFTAVATLPALAAGTEDLVGTGTSGQWLASNVKAGDTIAVTETISPDNNLSQAVSGGAIIVHDGAIAVPAQGGGENNINNPVTGVGVSADGKHAVVAVFDGHQSEGEAEGLTRPQLAGWMIAHGAANAILFDSGGSSEMVGRLPGRSTASALNTPSDGHERPVANGLFFYKGVYHLCFQYQPPGRPATGERRRAGARADHQAGAGGGEPGAGEIRGRGQVGMGAGEA